MNNFFKDNCVGEPRYLTLEKKLLNDYVNFLIH